MEDGCTRIPEDWNNKTLNEITAATQHRQNNSNKKTRSGRTPQTNTPHTILIASK